MGLHGFHIWIDLSDRMIVWLVVRKMCLSFHVLGIVISINELILFGGVGLPPTRIEFTTGKDNPN